MRRSLFLIKLQLSRLATLLKRDPNTGVFLWILQNLRTPISKNTCERLLLIVIYCTENWIKLFRNLLFCFFWNIKLLYFTDSYLYSFVLSLAVIRCHSFSFYVTPCQSLSFVVTFLPLAVPRFTGCTTRCHLLSFVVPLVVTRCHSLLFVVTWRTTRLSFYKRSQTSVENGWKS